MTHAHAAARTEEPAIVIRSYDPPQDGVALRACFVELQDDEHEIDPSAPRGEAIAESYLAWMFDRCSSHRGIVLVAEIGGFVVGFTTVLGSIARMEPDDSDPVHALVSELVVRRSHRNRGIGSMLLARAETYARSCGSESLRIQVHGRNEGAFALYLRVGFEPAMILLEKRV